MGVSPLRVHVPLWSDADLVSVSWGPVNGELAVGEGVPSRLLAWADFWDTKRSVSLQRGRRDPPSHLGGFWGCPIGLLAGTEVIGSNGQKEYKYETSKERDGGSGNQQELGLRMMIQAPLLLEGAQSNDESNLLQPQGHWC